MGGITSGLRGWRGGKRSTATLPEVRLTHSNLYAVAPRAGPLVRTEGAGWAVVTFGAHEWPVLLDTSPLHFGGARRWLACPQCSHRREALYIAAGVLACRACLGLRYESQHENTRTRMFRRVDAIRARLGWRAGVLSPDGDKPHRMHIRTYMGLRTELEGLTEKLFCHLGEWTGRAEALRQR